MCVPQQCSKGERADRKKGAVRTCRASVASSCCSTHHRVLSSRRRRVPNIVHRRFMVRPTTTWTPPPPPPSPPPDDEEGEVHSPLLSSSLVRGRRVAASASATSDRTLSLLWRLEGGGRVKISQELGFCRRGVALPLSRSWD